MRLNLAGNIGACMDSWLATCHDAGFFFYSHLIIGGEVVTSRYFHRKAVLSTLDQLVLYK
jgi:hypothetical protein